MPEGGEELGQRPTVRTATFALRMPGGRDGETETRIEVGDGILLGAIARRADLFRGRALFAISSPAILEHHGAKLEIESEPQRGALFRVRFAQAS